MSFQVENISFFYGEKSIIQQLSMILEPGKFYGLIGPNGCGKSTLLDILIRVRKPATGRIRYNEIPLHEYSKRALSRALALVPQNFYINFLEKLFHGSILYYSSVVYYSDVPAEIFCFLQVMGC